MTILTVADAVEVLTATCHRGARVWTYDAASMRVCPAEWNNLDDAAPVFTAWEALAVARGLLALLGPRVGEGQAGAG